jgi:hypothetical protein
MVEGSAGERRNLGRGAAVGEGAGSLERLCRRSLEGGGRVSERRKEGGCRPPTREMAGGGRLSSPIGEGRAEGGAGEGGGDGIGERKRMGWVQRERRKILK